jgi:hypothetical protein
MNNASIIETQSNLIINGLKDISELKVIEINYTNPIKIKVHRNFWSDFDIHYVVVGKLNYGIDLSSLNKSSIRLTKDSLILYLPTPKLIDCTIDHNKSSFVNQEWRLGVNEFELADMAYVQAQEHLVKYANSDELIEKSKLSCVNTVTSLIKNLGFESYALKINFINDL